MIDYINMKLTVNCDAEIERAVELLSRLCAEGYVGATRPYNPSWCTVDSNLYKRDFLDPKGDGVMYQKLELELFLNQLLVSIKENVDEECRHTNVEAYLSAFGGFIYLEFDSALNGHDRFFTYAEELQFVPILLEKLGIKWYPMHDRDMILRLAEIAS